MARIIQVLLPLVCVVLAEAQFHLPFFNNIPGLHPSRTVSNGPGNDQITHKNVGYDSGYNTWFDNFGNPEDQFSSESHETHNSYEDFDPFFNPYYHGDHWNHMPGINNAFNIPNPGYDNHRHHPPRKPNTPQKPAQNDVKPEEKPKERPPVDNTPTDQNKGPKLNDADDKISDVNNKPNEAAVSEEKKNPEELPPKTNEIKKEDDQGDKDKKQVDLDKKKDYLLVGQGGNANNVYLLHENNPNPTGVITNNANQPNNNIIYVPYNPGQPTNQVYQVVNGQPAPSPTNVQMTQEKLGTSNGYNNVVSTPAVNLNSGSQNPGYVTIYSNGQLIQIPGVVVNQVPSNVPVQTGNQGQGTNYVIANAVPNNVQTVPSNPGTNVIYAAVPNQASNGPIYVQVPNCCDSGAVIQNPVNGISNNGLPSNVVFYQANPNTVAQPANNDGTNVYVPSNMVPTQGQGIMTVSIPNQPNQGAVLSNQNVVYQPASQQPVNSGTNVYNQPIVSSFGQGQNAPIPGSIMNGQNVPIQTAVQMPLDSNNNGYNQPTATVTSQRQDTNAPDQGIKYNQNTPAQTGIEISIPSGYNENPPVINPSPTIESRDEIPSDQNRQPQIPVAVDNDSSGYNQPQFTIQGNQEANAIVNTPSGAVINQEPGVTQLLATSSLVLDSNNLSSLGAQPAFMISDFKEKSGDNKDKKKSKDKREKKDKGKKKDKKGKDDVKSKESKEKVDKPVVDQPEVPAPEPFTNKKIE